MTLRRIDYEKLEMGIMKYLYQNRKESNSDERTTRKLTAKFDLNKVSLSKALYELKGMGNVDNYYVGNAIVWKITEKGKEYLNEKKVLSDDDE